MRAWPSRFNLNAAAKAVVIYPRGLVPTATYDVRASQSGLLLRKTGAELMSEGISFDKIVAGELIFLNLPGYPGSGTDHVPPSSPANVTKRLGTNLGTQGIELSWNAEPRQQLDFLLRNSQERRADRKDGHGDLFLRPFRFRTR